MLTSMRWTNLSANTKNGIEDHVNLH